jgi:Pvc16 N-terminal domain
VSDYSVIRAVSQTLDTLLTTFITNSSDVQIKNIPVELLSPKEMEAANEDLGVSLWLYRATRMAEMLNEPPERKMNQIIPTPLPVLLHYLVTPIAKDPLTRHALMGKVLQVFNDHSILRGADLQGILQGTTEQLRITLEVLSLEDLSLIWDALNEPYQLSVSYLVQVVKIDSEFEPVQSSLVVEKDTKYTQILSVT